MHQSNSFLEDVTLCLRYEAYMGKTPNYTIKRYETFLGNGIWIGSAAAGLVLTDIVQQSIGVQPLFTSFSSTTLRILIDLVGAYSVAAYIENKAFDVARFIALSHISRVNEKIKNQGKSL